MSVHTQWCSPGLASQALATPALVWVVVDTETTGLDPVRDRLTEFAAVVIDSHGTLLETMSWVPADGEDALRAHGRALERYLEHGVFVAHNARFDAAVLSHVGSLVGTAVAAPVRWLCTMRLAGRPMRLDALAHLSGVDCHARHTAKGDAETLSVVLARLLDRARVRGLETIGGLAVVCPVSRDEGTAVGESEAGGWGRVRASLDLVVPKRLPGYSHRAAVAAAWAAQPDPSLGPVSIAAIDTVVADLLAADVSALVLDLCLEELDGRGVRAGLTASDT